MTSLDSEPPAISACPDRLEEVWDWWRDLMPVAKTWAYFDHAAVAPLPTPTMQVLQNYAVTAAAQGDVGWLDWSTAVNQLRTLTARLIHADADEVVLVPNTTTGINLVAAGFPWQPGDSVVIPEGEFPSNSFPWLNQVDRGVEVRVVPRREGRVEVDDLLSNVDATTRIIAVSWVGYASGFRIDIERLVHEAHRRSVLVFLDAIQGLGIYPLDLRTCDVDFLAADGHKWLLGPEGAGIAVIRRRHIDRLRCNVVGWASVKNSHQFSHAPFDLRDDAARFECGSANMAGLMAMAASLKLFVEVKERHGASAVATRVLERAATLKGKLVARGATILNPVTAHSGGHSGIVTFDVPGLSPADFRDAALANKVVVSCRGGGIRASVHVYNNDEDLNRLAQQCL